MDCCFLSSPQCAQRLYRVDAAAAPSITFTWDSIVYHSRRLVQRVIGREGGRRRRRSEIERNKKCISAICFRFFFSVRRPVRFRTFQSPKRARANTQTWAQGNNVARLEHAAIPMCTQQFEYFNCFCAIAIYINVDLNRGLAGSHNNNAPYYGCSVRDRDVNVKRSTTVT